MLKLDELAEIIGKHLDPNCVIALTQQLVSVPSHTAEGEEQAAAVLEKFLQSAGISTTRQQVEDVGVNVIATLPSATGTGGLLLNGHLDTVPPSSAMPFPPFAATIEDGKMWGRGTADMKGGIAAMACALAAIRAADIPLVRPLVLAAVASEERGNLGTAALTRSGIRAEWAVIGEATDLNLVTSHKGVDRYRVIVEGQAAHESMPDLGVNAIMQAASIITGLHETLWPEAKRHSHPVLGHPTYNIGTIEGGTSRNMIPDRCMFQMSKRWLPGDSPEAIRAEIEAAVRSTEPEAKVSVVREPEFDRIPHPPLDIAADHPLVRTLATVTTQLTGRTPRLDSWGAFTDGALLQEAGIPTVIFGPGDVSLAHTDDEHIELSQLMAAAELYAVFAAVVCSSKKMELGQGG